MNAAAAQLGLPPLEDEPQNMVTKHRPATTTYGAAREARFARAEQAVLDRLGEPIASHKGRDDDRATD